VPIGKIVRRARPACIRPFCWAALLLIAIVLVGGCESSTPTSGQADVSIKQDLIRGVRQIRASHDRKKLHAELVRVLERVRREHGTTPGSQRGRELAIQGFEATLKGVRSELDFDENDSGEVAAATRDAARADRYLTRGANRLRAAGRALGVQIGEVNGH
jgi:hypothetical protein